ncbi:putative Pentatricopeptide repeat-containing protein [Cocos nucifera]|uniref:Putative Pentatricopeptide repeat-containing protein n=1 Tax=Cocos nucifera TaxID=13894 RepID=A0A8K0I8X6_COCNU|nr:putative Pentatricopeptide repeat-containing protein [Cocos nucifera]
MSINHHLCISLLRDCKTLSHLKQIHAHASKTGLDADPLIAGKLLLLAAATLADALDYSRRLFSHFPSPDPFMYNTLIRGLSESDHPHHSLLTYNQMRLDSVPPDSFSFAFVLKAAANCRSLNIGWQLHTHVIHHGFESHLFVGTTLVSMYGECGCLDSARKAFDDIPQPNVVAWNAIVAACFRVDDVKGAQRLFERMPWKNLTSWNVMLAGYTKAGELWSARSLFLAMPNKDAVSWSTMITGFASNGLFNYALSFFRELLREGCRPNEVSLTGVLSACAQAGALESGKILHACIEKAGLSSIVSVGNALLDMYARCGSILMTSRVFNWEMEKKSIVSWTSMIAALAMHGYGKEALQLFHKMQEHGTRPDGITFISVLWILIL